MLCTKSSMKPTTSTACTLNWRLLSTHSSRASCAYSTCHRQHAEQEEDVIVAPLTTKSHGVHEKLLIVPSTQDHGDLDQR